jgi:uncharacterized membrane-anchored protein YitT (DUF2179 family)
MLNSSCLDLGNCSLNSISPQKIKLTPALYSVLTYYTASRTISFVIEGVEEYTGFTIISSQSEAIKQELVLKYGKGVTVYKGERGFLKESFNISTPCDIIFTVITRLEVRRLKNFINEVDPNAFVFTSTIKVAGGGVLKKRVRH